MCIFCAYFERLRQEACKPRYWLNLKQIAKTNSATQKHLRCCRSRGGFAERRVPNAWSQAPLCVGPHKEIHCHTCPPGPLRFPSNLRRRPF